MLYDPDDLSQVEVWQHGTFLERVRPLSPQPQRRPKAPSPSPPPPAKSSEERDNEWVDRLVDEGKALELTPDPIEEALAEQRRLDEQVVALIEDHVHPEVFDAKRVRDFLERFGPFDPRAVEDALLLALEFGGVDQHLDQLLTDLLGHQETP